MRIVRALLVLAVLCCQLQVVAARPAERRTVVGSFPLSLEGRVTKLEKVSEDAGSIGIGVHLALTFKNVGSRPIVIYRRDLWLGAISLSLTAEDAYAQKFLLDEAAWPSIWDEASRRKLYKALDQPSPPADLTLVIHPGQSWEYETDTVIGIAQKRRPGGRSLSWGEIRSHSTVWLQVTLEMWPVNAEPKVDPDRPVFGMRLRERWKSSAELWLDYLTSQPIRLELSDLQK